MMKSAVRIVATTFGVIVALAGIEHGAGEILQGNVPPPALVFESWPDSEFLEILAGEPAMSIVPNLLVSGILTVFFSLTLLAWSATALRKPYGGAGLIMLSAVLLLVGGGLGPPLMLFVAGLAATRILHPVSWWRPQSPDNPPPFLARSWRAALSVSVLGYLALLPAIPIAEQLAGPLDPTVVAVVGIFSFASFFLAIIAALASDSYDSELPMDRGR
jgi:hypothetical protein